MGECHLTISMKQISLLFFYLTLVSTEWTCDDCKAAAPSLGLYATSPSAIEFQSTTLVSELCPQAENVDECVERLPVFWGVLSPIIFPEHYSHVMIWSVMTSPLYHLQSSPDFLVVMNALGE